MLAGGLCALMLQTLHPRALAGVYDHSNFRQDLVGRLRRTTAFVAGTSYAPTGEVEALVARVRRIHAQIRGRTAQGEPYAADDPQLLTWVHVTEAFGFLQGFRRYGREVPAHIADRYYDEYRCVAEALGAVDVPRSEAEVAAYFCARQPELRGCARARCWRCCPACACRSRCRAVARRVPGGGRGVAAGLGRRHARAQRPPACAGGGIGEADAGHGTAVPPRAARWPGQPCLRAHGRAGGYPAGVARRSQVGANRGWYGLRDRDSSAPCVDAQPVPTKVGTHQAVHVPTKAGRHLK